MKKPISPDFFPTVIVHIQNFNWLSYLQAKKIDKYDKKINMIRYVVSKKKILELKQF